MNNGIRSRALKKIRGYECKNAVISVTAADEIKKHAADAYPYECCGILFGRYDQDIPHITDTVRTENSSPEGNAGRTFHMDPLGLYEYERQYHAKGLEILGFYHSHPDNLPVISESDDEYMIPEMVYAIVSAQSGGAGNISFWMKDKVPSDSIK